MLNIMAPKSINVASTLGQGHSLNAAGREVGYIDSTRSETMPLLPAPQTSSAWLGWVLNGHLGDFLGWIGQKVTSIARDVVSTPSIAERKRSKRKNRVALLQAFSGMVLEEDAEGKEALMLLQAYLEDVLVLLQSGHLSHGHLKKELSQVLMQAQSALHAAAATILREWLTRLGTMSSSEEISSAEQKVQSKREWRSGFSATVGVNDLTGTNGFTLDGTGINTGLGYSVSRAGDMNGDNYDDFIVGGAIGSNRVHILFGSATVSSTLSGGVWDLSSTALTGTNGFTVIGEGSSDWFGTSVSAAGDINGDGFDDVIIGAPYAPNGAGPGRAYVVFGAATATFTALGGVRHLSTTPLTGTDGFTLQGKEAYDFLGYSVSGAEDVNGDGFDDIIAGAIYAPYGAASGGGPGQAHVIFGGPSSIFAALPGGVWDLATNALTGSNGFSITGVTNGEAFGSAVSGAGDIDRDGYDDVIGGAPEAGGRGEARVIFGAPTATFVGLNGNIDLSSTALTGMNGFTISQGSDSSQLGFAVSQAGDVNRDGFSDILVGAPDIPFGYSSSGRAYVIFGVSRMMFAALPGAILDPTLLTGANGFTIEGKNVYDQLGFSVSAAGDINGDGFDDMIVGAVYAPYGAHPYPGEAYVIYGASPLDFLGLPNAVLNVQSLTGANGFTINGIASDSKLGFSVSGAGDLNGDGIGDVIVGAPLSSTVAYTNAGQAYVIFGQSSSSEGGGSTTGLKIDVNGLKIKQGKRILITPNQLSASLEGVSSDELLFTVSYGGQHGGSIHGYFEDKRHRGKEIRQFTQADIEAGLVYFVHNGGEHPPNYAINVCHGDSSLPVALKFKFEDKRREVLSIHRHYLTKEDIHDIEEGKTTDRLSDYWVNDVNLEAILRAQQLSAQLFIGVAYKKEAVDEAAVSAPGSNKGGINHFSPVASSKAASSGDLKIEDHQIKMKQGGKHRVRPRELSATVGGVKDNDLIFTISNTYRRHEHSYFKTIDQLGEVRQFPQGDIEAGKIHFVHDRTDDEPTYFVSVSKGKCTIPETVVLDFYDKHGKLVYSGRPAGASALRSDERIISVEEGGARAGSDSHGVREPMTDGLKNRSVTQASLLKELGLWGTMASRGNRPRLEASRIQPDLKQARVG